MIVSKSLTLNERLPLQGQIRILDLNVKKLYTALNGRIRFGDAADEEQGENVQGEFQLFTSDGTPDTEFSVTHGLGAIPLGRIILHQDIAGHLYQGPTTGTSWTDTTAFFKSDVASVTFLIFLLK